MADKVRYFSLFNCPQCPFNKTFAIQEIPKNQPFVPSGIGAPQFWKKNELLIILLACTFINQNNIMKQFHKLFFTILFVFAACLTMHAQNRFFTDAVESNIKAGNGKRTIIPQKYRPVSVNSTQLKTFLWSLPSEKKLANRKQAPVIELPSPDGNTARFRVWESSIQEPALEAKFPEIRTFLGQGIDDPYATIRFDYTDFGFHAQVLTVNGSYSIDPYARGDVNNYISYYRKDNQRQSSWTCEFNDEDAARTAAENIVAATGPCRGEQLYTYRLAVACTGEYAVAVGGTTAALLHSAIVTTVNRVVGVYENEVAVRMILVANNNLVEFLSAATDPFTGNNNAGTLINESQTVITNAIGSANFDIGHTFSTGGGGLAGLGVVCKTTQKARGITGSPSPVGDDYDIDYVAHEMGHQFGGNHTFNSTTSNCGGGNRNAATAYEVGSGTSIQAYAGICGTDDIQPHSDPHFHTVSFDEISNYLESASGGASCRVVSATGNTLPQITSMGATNLNIPVSTPFTLTATATDADGDALTYCWEEWDLGPGGAWNSGAASTTAPLFKSRLPKTSGSRTFPDPLRIAANYLPATPPAVMNGLKGETLPTVARAMKFRLTVRDNRAGGGGVVTGGNGCQAGFDGVFQVNTIAGSPFAVTVPNGGESYAGGSTQTITWNVVGTNAAPFNVANVKITLSTDGGLTFPTVISASTANDGTEALTIPSIATTTARVKVEAIDNVFFDISNANFTITAPAQNFTFNSAAPASVSCGTATASITLGTTASGGFSTPINLTASGNPAGTTVGFTSNPLTPGNSTTVTLNNTNTLAPGDYNVTVTGVAGAVTQNSILTFTITPVPPSITTQPAAATVCSGSNAIFTVAAGGTGLSYQWQVSTDGGTSFSNISGATSASYTATAVTGTMNNNQYHVIVSTLCGSTTSSNVLLTVNDATAITTQPAASAVCAGTNTTFTVQSSGTNLGYSWQVSTAGCAGPWAPLGISTPTLTLTNVTLAQDGYAYQVVITGTCAPTSITSNCAVLTVTGTVNIATQPVSVTACSGTNAVFTVAASGSGVNYQWQVSTDGGATFNDMAGETNATLTIPAVTVGLSGNQYQVILSNAACATPATSNAVTLTVNASPSVTTDPTDLSVCPGDNAVFTGAGAGTNSSLQWQVSTDGGATFNDIAGETNATLTITGVTAAVNNNQYHLVVSGTCTPSAVSANATLTVFDPTAISTQPTAQSGCSGSDVTISATATGSGLAYQWQVSTDGGTTFTDIPGETNADLNLSSIADAMNNNIYHVVVTGCTVVTSANAALTVNPLPVIDLTAAPYLNITATTTTTLTASSTPAASGYAWYLNNSLVPSATSNTLEVAHADTGSYYVIATDANGCSNKSNTVTIGDSAISFTFIYPNPNNGFFHVRFAGVPYNGKPRYITLFDGKGSRVYSKAYYPTVSYEAMEVRVMGLSKGVYALVLSDSEGNNLATGKVLIQ